MPMQRRMMSPVSTIISRRKSSQIDRVGFSVLRRLCRRFAISAVARENDYAASKDRKMEGHERKYYRKAGSLVSRRHRSRYAIPGKLRVEYRSELRYASRHRTTEVRGTAIKR